MISRVLIVRLGSMGDLIHTLPAAAAIRRAYPEVQLDWIVEAIHAELLGLVPVLSSVLTLADRSAGAWLAARRELSGRRYDIALDFQGLVKSAALTRLSLPGLAIGFDRASAREGAAALFYHRRVAAEGGHVIEKNLRLAAAIEARTNTPEFPLREADSTALGAIRREVSGPFALINPGAAWPNKRWPPARFAAMARHLEQQHGLRSVVLWGPAEESLAQEIVNGARRAAVVAPATRLTDLVAIARAAAIMVSGDTGPTHIAAAVGTPVVALFGPTNPHRNGPWRAEDISLSRYESCGCHYQRSCARGADWCLATVTEADVTAAIDRRLAVAAPARAAR